MPLPGNGERAASGGGERAASGNGERAASGGGDSTRAHQADGLARVLRALVSGTTHLVLLFEADGTIVYVGRSVTRLLGLRQEELVGRNVLALMHPDHAGKLSAGLALAVAADAADMMERDDAAIAAEVRLRHHDGHWVAFEFLFNGFLADPEIRAILAIGQQVNARRALDDALTALAHDIAGVEPLVKLVQFVDTSIEHAKTAIFTPEGDVPWITDQVPDDLLTDHGPWQSAIATGESVIDRMAAGPGDPADGLRATARSAGMQSCWCLPIPLGQSRILPVAEPRDGDGAPLGCMVIWSAGSPEPLEGYVSVIERAAGLAELALRRRRESRRLEELATYDLVTGTLNRAGFEAALDELGGDQPGYLAIIDLDDFKEVNDGYGHPVGDRVLRTTAERISSVIGPGDLLGRLGGDEFVLRLTGDDAEAVAGTAGRIVEVTTEPVVVDGIWVDARVSVGLAPCGAGTSRREQVARADKALYDVKRNGKGGWRMDPTPPG